MEPNTQENQISNTKDKSQLNIKLIYVSKFPVWSTFYTYLPLIIISLYITLKFYLSFIHDFRNRDTGIKTIIKFNAFIIFIVIASFLVTIFASKNFQVPVLTGSYQDYLKFQNYHE